MTFSKEFGIPFEVGRPVAVSEGEGGGGSCRWQDISFYRVPPVSIFTVSNYFAISFGLGPFLVEVDDPDLFCLDSLGDVPPQGVYV